VMDTYILNTKFQTHISWDELGPYNKVAFNKNTMQYDTCKHNALVTMSKTSKLFEARRYMHII